jgi:hypothetical protein
MKKILIVVAAFTVAMTISNVARAKGFPWQGAQLQAGIGGAIPVVGDKLSVRASACLFTVPENKFIMAFVYSGPVWSPADWIWIAPQIGYAANWMTTDAGIVSVWIGLSFFEGKLTIFTENEAIFNHRRADYYGFHSVDYNPLAWLNIGAQAEAVNRNVMFGPHVGFSKGPWHMEIQWYAGAQPDNTGHAVRLATFLNF